MGVSRLTAGGVVHSFNCLLPAFKCTQFANCSDYDGRCQCPPGFGGDDCLKPGMPYLLNIGQEVDRGSSYLYFRRRPILHMKRIAVILELLTSFGLT